MLVARVVVVTGLADWLAAGGLIVSRLTVALGLGQAAQVVAVTGLAGWLVGWDGRMASASASSQSASAFGSRPKY